MTRIISARSPLLKKRKKEEEKATYITIRKNDKVRLHATITSSKRPIRNFSASHVFPRGLDFLPAAILDVFHAKHHAVFGARHLIRVWNGNSRRPLGSSLALLRRRWLRIFVHGVPVVFDSLLAVALSGSHLGWTDFLYISPCLDW